MLSDFQRESQSQHIDYTLVESEVVNRYLEQCRKYDGNGSPNGIRKEMYQQDKSVTLFDPSALTMPVLVIGGANDGYISLKQIYLI